MLAEKRVRLVEDSVRRGSENETMSQRITGEIALLNNQLATLQDEQARLQTTAGEPEHATVLSSSKPVKDYYSERVTEPEPETVSEDEIRFFQEKQKLESLIKARENAERDIGTAEQTIAEKRREIDRQNKLIYEKQKEVDRLARALKEGRGTGVATSPAVANARAKEIAQQRLEEIYMLLSNNDISTAVRRFMQLRSFLKPNLDPEAFQMLIITLKQMGAVLQ
jgi:hypothetical protein